MRILVVGAGIGGLTLALALRRAGLDHLVIEKSTRLSPIGAGITLSLNALSILSQLIDRQALIAAGQALLGMDVTDATGQSLSLLSAEDLASQDGLLSLGIHRGELHAQLLGPIPKENIKLGTSLRQLHDDGESVLVEFSDGSSERFAAVIGADGIHSSVRQYVDPEALINYAGYTCWRFVVPATLKQAQYAAEMWGLGRRFGYVPIGSGLVYVFTTLNAPAGGKDSQDPKLNLRLLRENFASFAGEAPHLLSALTEETKLIRNDLEDISIARWHRGRINLLGDAAHAMTPNLGQGAAMAIEDAWVLAECLTQCDTTQAAFARYERQRRPRVEWMLRRSRKMGTVAQWASPLACQMRDTLFRMVPNALVRLDMKRILQGPLD